MDKKNGSNVGSFKNHFAASLALEIGTENRLDKIEILKSSDGWKDELHGI